MDVSKLSENIIKNLSTIPGILNFCNIDETHQVLIDPKTWFKSLLVSIAENTINLNLAIIISIDSTINNISKQIKEQLLFDFKKLDYKLGVMNIYIKGVK